MVGLAIRAGNYHISGNYLGKREIKTVWSYNTEKNVHEGE